MTAGNIFLYAMSDIFIKVKPSGIEISLVIFLN